jgi:hypothetical protein
LNNGGLPKLTNKRALIQAMRRKETISGTGGKSDKSQLRGRRHN